jgi:uncharacterized glyoxalase superfamily protein PhnB
MAETVSPNVIPHLRYERPPEAIDWLTRVFGFRERTRLSGPSGRLYVSELVCPGGAVIMLGGFLPPAAFAKLAGFRPAQDRGWPNLTHSTTVLMPEVDQHFARARAEGAQILAEPRDQPWGIREYEAIDLEGHHWQFGHRFREVQPHEWGAKPIS